MKSEDLKNVRSDILEREIERRKKLIYAKEAKIQAEEELKRYKNRPNCIFVGKGYGEDIPDYIDLASVNILGNCSHTYAYHVSIPSSVKTYFHNAWSDELKREFETLLKIFTEWFIKTKIEPDINVITTLMCLSAPHLNTQKYPLWKEAAVERLCEFPLDNLKAAYEKTKHSYSVSGHNQEKIIKEAIDKKETKKIKDAKQPELNQELKIAFSIAKLKGNTK